MRLEDIGIAVGFVVAAWAIWRAGYEKGVRDLAYAVSSVGNAAQVLARLPETQIKVKRAAAKLLHDAGRRPDN